MVSNKRIPLAAQVVQMDSEGEPVTGISIEQNFQYATWVLFGMQILLILLLGGCATDNMIGNNNFDNAYQFFTGVEIMMFIGFGYLMTFLKRYGMGAVGLTMLVTVVAMQWGIWTEVRTPLLCVRNSARESLQLDTNRAKFSFSLLSVRSGSSRCGTRACGPTSPSISALSPLPWTWWPRC
jgi:hypothetical protein